MDVTDVLRRLVRLRLAVAGVLVLAIAAAGVAYVTAGSLRLGRTSSACNSRIARSRRRCWNGRTIPICGSIRAGRRSARMTLRRKLFLF